MRYLNRFLLFSLVFSLASCVDFNDATVPVSVDVQIVQPTDFLSPADLSGKTVSMEINGQTISVKSDANGKASFTNITPDVYNISTSWSMTGDEYAAMTGSTEAITGATVSGSVNSRLITGAETIEIGTNVSVNRDIVIGKVFYAGSRDNNNRNYMAGKYIELYNQGNEPVDFSGLYIGMTEAESTPAYTAERIHEVFKDSVVLLKQAYRIPADKPYMVAPGGTVIICNSAIDHTTNNINEHDLTAADFEVKDVSGKYQNNPATPAMEHSFHSSAGTTVMNILQSGPAGVVIFKTKDDISTWKKTYAYGKTSGTQWLLCPVRYILDAVESLKLTASGIDVKTKRMPESIDAGYININAITGWNGETIYRKTLKTTDDGRVILVDTNNSSNDFQVSKTIQPREYDK